VRQPEVPRRTPLSAEEQTLVNQICERNRAEADQYLDELPTRLNLAVETRLELAESVTSTLRRWEETSGAQLMIVSAHGYSGDSTLPYGSTATNLLVYGSLPLLVIQDLPPERFEPSPAEKALQARGKR
jgi:nucleotide-binding universal stress UspA family protein